MSALIFAALPSAAANIEVRVVAGRVDLQLPGAALSEVLTRLSTTLGFKLTREEGVADPYLPALELKGRTPVETVLGVLDGQGLNYAITMDESGTKVESLLLTATKPPTEGATPPRLTPTPGAPRFPRMNMPQPDANDDSSSVEPPDIPAPPAPVEDEPPPAAPPPAASPAATPPGPRPIRLPQPYTP